MCGQWCPGVVDFGLVDFGVVDLGVLDSGAVDFSALDSGVVAVETLVGAVCSGAVVEVGLVGAAAAPAIPAIAPVRARVPMINTALARLEMCIGRSSVGVAMWSSAILRGDPKDRVSCAWGFGKRCKIRPAPARRLPSRAIAARWTELCGLGDAPLSGSRNLAL
jgi:hypothetical protein